MAAVYKEVSKSNEVIFITVLHCQGFFSELYSGIQNNSVPWLYMPGLHENVIIVWLLWYEVFVAYKCQNEALNLVHCIVI